MLFNLTTLSDKPIHSQLAMQLLEKILADDDYDGSQLPSIRSLAREQHISVCTVEKAYETLIRGGLIARKSDGLFCVPVFTEEEKKIIARQFGRQISNSKFHEFERELHIARNIQMHMMPKSLHEDEDISIATFYKSSKAVGGDFYDYFQLPGDRLGMVIADACGNGLPAALLISQIQGIIRSQVGIGFSIEKTLENINRQIFRYTPKDKFITLFYGLLDKKTLEFNYGTAGHNFPMLIESGGGHKYLSAGGPGLGILAATKYNSGTLSLAPGDILCLYTDGITEIMNSNSEEYGEQRLLNLLRKEKTLPPSGVINAVLEDLRNFDPGESPQDDQTLLLMKIKQTPIEFITSSTDSKKW